MDFLQISTKLTRGGVEIYPKFVVKSSSDLMIRGGDFYAIWNDKTKLWSTSEDVAIEMIDNELRAFANQYNEAVRNQLSIQYLWDGDSGMIDKWHKYCRQQMWENYRDLDEKLVFSNEVTDKKDYASKKLPYPLVSGPIDAWEELVGTLYEPAERHKIEWAIGAIVSGDSKEIQKFLVFYGAPGSGKGTVLKIISKLFKGYTSVFDAKVLGSSSNAFALEAFTSNPLVAIQFDGDLSKIEDNTRINSLVSHEEMTVNEKFKKSYSTNFKSFLFMGTNKAVRITDSNSGIIRRLIDVNPSKHKVPPGRYEELMSQIDFELGAIANHCLQVYMDNPRAYDDYVAVSMLSASNDFYNFIMDSFDKFQSDDGTSLQSAWELYKNYCEEAKVPYPYSLKAFKEELKNYFREFEERTSTKDGVRVRNYYSGFIFDKFIAKPKERAEKTEDADFQFLEQESLFDKLYGDCPAQYASSKDTPKKKWDEVLSKLSDLNTKQVHYVKPPENHIVIDFDLKDETGAKSFRLNWEAARKWPKTYAEVSKGGSGIHLHYIYDGDPSELSCVYDEGIEVKIFTGKSSLRRRLSKCVNHPIAHLNSGLEKKGGKAMSINKDIVETDKTLRTTIRKALAKDGYPGTASAIQHIHHILENAYEQGVVYDLTDMRSDVLAFASGSTNHSVECVKLVDKMHFSSEPEIETEPVPESYDCDIVTVYDSEVYPNLFIIGYKRDEIDPVMLVNPSPEMVEEVIKMKLVDFNGRKYDRHILYAAAYLKYSNEQLYKLSKRIISGDKDAFFSEAYNIGYTDILDFSSKKQSLKKWEIELGIHHQEIGLPWDEPVPPELWDKVIDYCKNDVIATEALWKSKAIQADFKAREMLAAVTGLTVNDTTNTLTKALIFGKERNPQLVYVDLATGIASDPEYQNDSVINKFPGYRYVNNFGKDIPYDRRDGINMYRGEDVGHGGYVWAKPGMYGRVVTYDVASEHPHSAITLNVFGKYTTRFKELVDARVAIKGGRFDDAKKMLGGALAPYLDDPGQAKALAGALKIAINSVYGLTSANFPNPFKDPRNGNNIVALKGALFMVDLKNAVLDKGYEVIHCKTDSIKVVDPSPEIEEFIMNFGKSYGYEFEIEHVFERFCLVNDAVYIAKLAEDDPENPGEWTATGAQFAVPYVFKTLFSKEPIIFEDTCELKSVKSAIYLDFDEDLEDVSEYEKLKDAFIKRIKAVAEPEARAYKLTRNDQKLLDKYAGWTIEDIESAIAKGHSRHFVGRVGLFCPIKPGCGGARLVREQDGKFYSVTGAKDYRWMESEMVRLLGKEDDIDLSYYRLLTNKAKETIEQYGDAEVFINGDSEEFEEIMDAPF